MARKKLGAFKRIKQKRDEKLAEKKKVAEKRVDAKNAETAPAKAAVAELVVARKEATAAENKAINAEAAGAKLVSPAKVQSLKKQAEAKVAVVKQLEHEVVPTPVAAPVVVSDLETALSVFEWALILAVVGAEVLKISKWYAVGGAAVLAALFFLAEKQGWIDFINF
jgi:hypothetical protein